MKKKTLFCYFLFCYFLFCCSSLWAQQTDTTKEAQFIPQKLKLITFNGGLEIVPNFIFPHFNLGGQLRLFNHTSLEASYGGILVFGLLLSSYRVGLNQYFDSYEHPNSHFMCSLFLQKYGVYTTTTSPLTILPMIGGNFGSENHNFSFFFRVGMGFQKYKVDNEVIKNYLPELNLGIGCKLFKTSK